jgi:hypothetical protein
VATPKLTGGSAYNEAVEKIDEEIERLAELAEQLQAGMENGNLHKLRAAIMAALLRQQKALNKLKEIGLEAKQERKER